jgi:hypothetical protein
MAPRVFEELKKWQVNAKAPALGLVFPNSVGKVQNYSNIYNRVFKPMMVKQGIFDDKGSPKFAIHSLRHDAASLFIEQGWNPKNCAVIVRSLLTLRFNVTLLSFGSVRMSLLSLINLWLSPTSIENLDPDGPKPKHALTLKLVSPRAYGQRMSKTLVGPNHFALSDKCYATGSSVFGYL